jgi:hypothetical protein
MDRIPSRSLDWYQKAGFIQKAVEFRVQIDNIDFSWHFGEGMANVVQNFAHYFQLERITKVEYGRFMGKLIFGGIYANQFGSVLFPHSSETAPQIVFCDPNQFSG